ncbi:MAG: MFS transporter [Streptococcaceae bacterium]|nr:MFS transporter [Streptococcaceae bacterium]
MRDFRALDKNLQLRLVIVFLGAFSYGTLFSSMTIYYNQYFGSVLTGMLLAFSSVIAFLSGLIAGYFSDRFGRRPTMLWGTEVSVVGALVATLANSPLGVNAWVTYGGFLLISTGYNLIVTAGNAMIIDASDVKNRKTVFSLDYWAQNLSVVFGAAVGAWLFKPAFFVLLVLLVLEMLVTYVITYFWITETKKTKRIVTDNLFSSYKTVVKDKTYLIFLGANTLSLFIILQFDNYLPVHLSDNFQTFTFLGLTIYGQRMLTIYLIIACLLVVLFMQSFNHLTAKWRNQTSFIIGLILMTLGMSLSFIFVTFWPIIIASFIYTFGEIIYTPAVQTIGASLMAPDKIGAYNGASSLRQPIASILAASLVTGSAVLKTFGIVSILALTSFLSILLVMQAIIRHSRKKEKQL